MTPGQAGILPEKLPSSNLSYTALDINRAMYWMSMLASLTFNYPGCKVAFNCRLAIADFGLRIEKQNSPGVRRRKCRISNCEFRIWKTENRRQNTKNRF